GLPVAARGAVGGLHGALVDVVVIGVGGGLKVGRRDKGERSGCGIDGEQGGIGTAGNRIAERLGAIRIGGRHQGDRRGVLGDRQRSRVPAAVGDDGGGSVGGQHRRGRTAQHLLGGAVAIGVG